MDSDVGNVKSQITSRRWSHVASSWHAELRQRTPGCGPMDDFSGENGGVLALDPWEFQSIAIAIAGWWFGCHQFYFPRNIGNVIIPIDEVIFFRGVALAHQPDCHCHPQQFLGLVATGLAKRTNMNEPLATQMGAVPGLTFWGILWHCLHPMLTYGGSLLFVSSSKWVFRDDVRSTNFDEPFIATFFSEGISISHA